MIDLSRPFHQLATVVIDTETTGIGDDDRIVEIATVRYEDCFPVAKWCSLVDPGIDIPDAATAIHGISNADVRGMPALEDVAGELLRVSKDAVPCAYSANFDRAMLHKQISGADCLAFDPAQSWIDVLVLVRHFDRRVSGKGKNKLEKACARHGITLEGAHRALADALACGGLLWAFKPRLRDMRAADLIRRCDERRAEQERDFQEWLARQNALNGAAE